jgi:hypothetical protein
MRFPKGCPRPGFVRLDGDFHEYPAGINVYRQRGNETLETEGHPG